jgi:hypothetical protein
MNYLNNEKLMKYIQFILVICLAVAFSSCKKTNEQQQVNAPITENKRPPIGKIEIERLLSRLEREEQEIINNIRLERILQGALNFVYQNATKDTLRHKYLVTPETVPTQVDINLDYHFTKAHPHLMIRRNQIDAVYIDIYAKRGTKFEKVLKHDQWEMEYTNDTIRDINGDGLNDFVVNWYGSSGCCLKAFSNVYLLRQDKQSFSLGFEFINPTFSPKENIIRGVCYGHPGNTEIYKYKWNGEQVDTIEYVYYQKDSEGEKTGKVVISNKHPYSKGKILKTLNSVPAEYRKIMGYDWFTGNW